LSGRILERQAQRITQRGEGDLCLKNVLKILLVKSIGRSKQGGEIRAWGSKHKLLKSSFHLSLLLFFCKIPNREQVFHTNNAESHISLEVAYPPF
jgi:hypothetical protein